MAALPCLHQKASNKTPAKVTAQLEAVRKLCQREGYEVIAEFCDKESGRTPPKGYEERFKHDTVTQRAIAKQRSKSREGFGRVCKMIEAGEVQVLAVRDSTRIARPKARSDFIGWIPEFFRDHKVDIHSINEGYLKHDDENRMMYQIILDSMVDKELSKWAENSASQRRTNKENGIYEGQPYYGVEYVKGSKVYTEVKKDADVVRLIFDR